MSKEFKLPDLGEGIHEAQIVKLLINQGDTVKEDQMVMEVETDKAAVELPVPFAGVVSTLNVKVGDTVKVGSVLLSVDDAGSGTKSSAPRAPEKRQEKKWTDERGTEEPEEAGRETRPGGKREAAHEERAPEKERPKPESSEEFEEEERPRATSGPVPAAPAVRRMAREMGIDLHDVRGSGPGGRIVREDVEKYQLTSRGAKEAPAGAAPAEPSRAARPAAPAPSRETLRAMPAVPAEALPDFSIWGPIRREPVSQIRKTIARQMVRSATIIPHVTHCDEVDATDLEGFRRGQAAIFADKGAKLTLTAFVVKAVAGALREFPQFNASFDDAAGEMVFKDYVHIGIAVDSPKGLLVPVIRDADKKGLVAISKELKELGEKAREFKIDVAQMRGGTFTITNVGAMGGTMATPIINYPEVAILGMGKLEEKPVVRDGQIVVRKILPLFLSFDHRAVDGADGARFIRTVMTFLENPMNLLLVS